MNLNKEVTKLKMELSAKLLDLEQLEESKRKQEATCKTLQEEITRVREEYTTKVNEYENILNETSQENEKHLTEIAELKQSLITKVKEYEKLLSDSSSNTSVTEKLISEYKQTIHERDKEIIKLKDDFEQATANFNIKHSKIAEEHKKEIEDRNTKIEELLKEIQSHKLTLDQNKVDFESLNSQFITNADELKALKEENMKLKQSIVELTECNNDLKAKVSAMELEVGELKRQLESAHEKCEELQKAKENVETEYLNLTGQTSDSNEQFNKLSHHLKETDKELQDFKDRHREAVNSCARIEQEFKQKIIKLQEDYSLERSQLVQSVNENIEKLKEMELKVKELETHITDKNNSLRDIQCSNDNLLDENTILKKEIEALKLKEQEQCKDYEAIQKKLEIDIDKYKEEVSILKEKGASSEVKLIEKVDQLTEAQNDLNNKLEEARKQEGLLQKLLDDMTTQLSNQKLQHEKEITQVQSQITALTEEANNLKMEENKLKEALEEKQNNLKDLSLKLEMLEVDLKSNLEIVAEKDRQITQANEELSKVTELKKQYEEKFNNAQLENSSVKQLYENLIANSTAEESLLNEQLAQVENLRKEITVLNQDKTALEIKCNETLNELNKLKEEHVITLNKLNENISMNVEIKKDLEEKEKLLQSQSELIKSESTKVKELEEELLHIKEDLTIKINSIQQKESDLAKLQETLQAGSNESLQMVTQVQLQYDELNERHKKEIESLNNNVQCLQRQITEKEKETQETKELKEKVDDLQKLIAKSDEDIKQLTNINEAQKQNYEDLNKQLQGQFDEYKKENKRMKHELNNKLNDYEKELQDSKEKLKIEIDKHFQVQQMLTEAEKKILELSQKLDLVQIQQSTDVEKDSKLEKLTMELQAAKNCLAESVSNNETLVNKLKSDIESKIKDLTEKDDLILRLQEEVKVRYFLIIFTSNSAIVVLFTITEQ